MIKQHTAQHSKTSDIKTHSDQMTCPPINKLLVSHYYYDMPCKGGCNIIILEKNGTCTSKEKENNNYQRQQLQFHPEIVTVPARCFTKRLSR